MAVRVVRVMAIVGDREYRVLTSDGRARLFARDIGVGDAIVVVHGGPDFDQSYLSPELDRLRYTFRLVYYDQRGRGRSAKGVSAADVTIASEVSDLDTVRRSLGLDRFVLLGHSWGGVIAMAYTVSHPRHVSALVLMNCAPPSADGAELFASAVSADRTDEHKAALAALRDRPDFRAGDVDADAEYYRLHFAGALPSIDAVDSLVARLRVNVAADGIALARAIEERLYDETWRSPDFDLLPSLRGLRCPTLVIHGDRDFIPDRIARTIAEAIPGAQLEVYDDCGHFAFIEHFERFQRSLVDFLVHD